MSEPKNYIQINGRRYNAQTGQLIQDSVTLKAVEHNPVSSDSANMDGVMRHSRPTLPHRPENVARTIKPAKTKSTQKSSTLMRPAVKKPDHKAIASKHRAAHSPVPHVINHPHDERLKRAGEVKKSPHIRRFNPFNHQSSVVKKQAPLHVVPHAKNQSQTEENIIQKSIHQSVDQFEQAIHGATSHMETYIDEHTPKKFRKLAFATVSLSVIVLCGFVLYQAVPTVKVKMAGNKAGFSANLPDYSPAGYGLSGDIAANSGEVTLAYSSRTDSKGYKVHQQPSNWNSQSLVNNFLLVENKPYQTYENNGKTVYIYDETNATWIDGGIWYRVEGDASLTSDQLLRIADGL